MSQGQNFGGRRTFLKRGAIGVVGLGITTRDLFWQTKLAQAAELPAALSPDAALQKLLEGNQRFVKQESQHPHQSQARLLEVAQAQHPFATVLSCADSRVPAEILFDQGIGDIFDIRIAGNIATPEAIGSIEYAVGLLGSPLLMVLGHERCGAVTAAVQKEALPGDISTFVKAIQPALTGLEKPTPDGIDRAVTANVHYQIDQLRRSSLLAERLQSGKLKIVAGRYDLDTGTVTIL
ncbi:carbonic anhydrase [Pantanalinema sp. GBBB05]|uniref:carbonic anhydrase n=1 Tax=Pantanalinema sp. GBBB05 TaxID=2604139 RepID=UPI001D9DB089|nr:carbonic anhydrase [Pantanalinema sp. GBBB05]